MIEKMTHVNPKMLIWAREMIRIPLSEVESKFSRIADWENGKDYPTYSQLKDLACLYHRPVAVFFFPEEPKLKNITASCRTLPKDIYSELSTNALRLFEKARVMQINVSEMHEIKEDKLGNFCVFKSLIKDPVNDLRTVLGVSIEDQRKIFKKNAKRDDVFEFWREKFYEMGIYVFKDSFNEENLSGFCLYDEFFPIIYINNSFSFTRQIFTLFHELYHILKATSGIDFFDDEELQGERGTNFELELECNNFADEILVPTYDFLDIVKDKDINDENIKAWADLYCVSREVILKKLLDNKYIDYSIYLSKKKEFREDYIRIKKSNVNGGSYYNIQNAYKGKRYFELAFGLYYSHKISVTQLANYTNMKITVVNNIAMLKGWGII